MNKCYFKSVRLYPTLFHVDIWICKDLDLLAANFHKRYGASVDYYKEELYENSVQTITSTLKSELKGDKIIVMNVQSLELGILFHELNHVYYHLCKCVKIPISSESQEWHSYILEYLYNECKTLDKFELRNE